MWNLPISRVGRSVEQWRYTSLLLSEHLLFHMPISIVWWVTLRRHEKKIKKVFFLSIVVQPSLILSILPSDYFKVWIRWPAGFNVLLLGPDLRNIFKFPSIVVKSNDKWNEKVDRWMIILNRELIPCIVSHIFANLAATIFILVMISRYFWQSITGWSPERNTTALGFRTYRGIGFWRETPTWGSALQCSCLVALSFRTGRGFFGVRILLVLLIVDCVLENQADWV